MAVAHPLYEDLMEGYVNKYLVIGFDSKARLLEIGYNKIDNNNVNIFHLPIIAARNITP